jgi:membrane-associated HD superfamily phosphohydrolase
MGLSKWSRPPTSEESKKFIFLATFIIFIPLLFFSYELLKTEISSTTKFVVFGLTLLSGYWCISSGVTGLKESDWGCFFRLVFNPGIILIFFIFDLIGGLILSALFAIFLGISIKNWHIFLSIIFVHLLLSFAFSSRKD